MKGRAQGAFSPAVVIAIVVVGALALAASLVLSAYAPDIARGGSGREHALSRSAVGRTALLAPLKARPWSTSPEEAVGAREGFADSRDYWRTLLWGLLLDVPRGLDRIDCPVTLVQGVADWVASGQTVRYLPLVPRSRFRPLLWGGHAPQSDRPRTIVRLVEDTARRAGQPAESSAFRYEQRNRAPDIASVKRVSQAGSVAGKAV